MNFNEAYDKLNKYKQTHALKYYEELSDAEKSELLAQINDTDFSIIDIDAHKDGACKKGEITPLSAMQLSEIEERRDEFFEVGIDAIKSGKVAAMLLAGGMGTRLGSDDPKGMYNIGLTKDVFIFERLINNLMDVVNAAGTYIHLFIMTSDKNNEATTKFFDEKNYFGYDRKYVHFFIQDMAPAVDYDGKVYMEEKYKMSTSPNGNGGWFSSMARSGALHIVKENGIEWLNCFSVDNVLQRICDPVFVGATIITKSNVGSKVVRKVSRDEKVGVMCLEDGKPSIVEYYELSDELMDAVDSNGERLYNFGVILNYLFNVNELEKIVNESLPLHVVEKKIPYMDENGNYIQPEEPNGYKFETLILDMIHMMDTCLPFEVVRNREFAPIKNKTGVDSVESAQALCKENGIEL